MKCTGQLAVVNVAQCFQTHQSQSSEDWDNSRQIKTTERKSLMIRMQESRMERRSREKDYLNPLENKRERVDYFSRSQSSLCDINQTCINCSSNGFKKSLFKVEQSNCLLPKIWFCSYESTSALRPTRVSTILLEYNNGQRKTINIVVKWSGQSQDGSLKLFSQKN